ncbi:MAG: 4Fe-4S binding protein [Phycisphaerae bacterium]|nr:4Fe-4S binding protein [Phycisphaerae bacterium]
MAGKIEINTDRCKGCYLCIEACPKNCIIIGQETNASGYFPAVFEYEDKCIGCSMCAMVCPEVIIKVYRD